jgi:hypothetical protein
MWWPFKRHADPVQHDPVVALGDFRVAIDRACWEAQAAGVRFDDAADSLDHAAALMRLRQSRNI